MASRWSAAGTTGPGRSGPWWRSLPGDQSRTMRPGSCRFSMERRWKAGRNLTFLARRERRDRRRDDSRARRHGQHLPHLARRKDKDFELKFEYHLSGTNSGVQYRSAVLTTVGQWVMKGYQADLDFTEGFVGNIHDERGRSPSGEGHVILFPARPGDPHRRRTEIQGARENRRPHAPARRHERQRLEPVSHHRARAGDPPVPQ